MDIHSISVSEARSIRQQALRPGRPASEITYPCDDSEFAIHLGAFEDGRLVGVATLLPEKCTSDSGVSAWRLRGMAVLESARGHGLGSQLLMQGVERAFRAGVNILWCNGRVSARSFYEGLGFSAIGDAFLDPVTGPHYLFVLQMRADNSFEADGFVTA